MKLADIKCFTVKQVFNKVFDRRNYDMKKTKTIVSLNARTVFKKVLETTKPAHNSNLFYFYKRYVLDFKAEYLSLFMAEIDACKRFYHRRISLFT